jgi:sec-independent protein translocase protein TatB
MSLAEILVVLVLVLVVVGPERLPEVARTIGKGLREVRRATNLFRDTMMVEDEIDVDTVDQHGPNRPIDVPDEERPSPTAHSVSRPQSNGGARGTRMELAEIEPANPGEGVRRVALHPAGSADDLRSAFLPLPHREIRPS